MEIAIAQFYRMMTHKAMDGYSENPLPFDARFAGG
jgi:hypothetical protein